MYRIVAIATAALLLASCSDKAPAPAPSETSLATMADPVPVMGPEKRILAVGDSLFAGYGLKSGESYPSKLEVARRAQGLNVRIANAGVSGDTSAAGAQRLGFVLDSQKGKPDLVIIEFGGNDVLRGLPPTETRKNIEAMLAETKKRGRNVLLMGMLAPPNLGPDYKAEFEPIHPELAKKYGAKRVEFFLAPLIGKPDLVQADHVHPTANGVEEIVKANASEVAAALK